MKVDGHTHTHFCPHGSGEDTELFILRAIELGFEQYSLTEHSPIPSSFKQKLPYDEELINYLAMQESELDAYVKEMHKIKQKYKDRLKIQVGLEIDFLPDHIEWTRHLLNEYGNFLDETILSIHFLEGENGWRCVDLNPDDYNDGLVQYYGNFNRVQLEYYKVLQEAVVTDFGNYAPGKIGHINLCQKFQHYFKGTFDSRDTTLENAINSSLNLIKERDLTLDYNFGGMFKPYCKEPYPSEGIVNRAKALGIKLIYGSDAHKVNEVGRGYENYLFLK